MLGVAGIVGANVVGFPEVEVGEGIAGLGTAAVLQLLEEVRERELELLEEF